MRRSKYGVLLGDTDAEKAAARADRTYDGVVYDSRAEARYAEQLDLLKRAGEIRRWERQVAFDLVEPDHHRDSEKHKRSCILYVLDFSVHGHWNRNVGIDPYFVDVKGMQTPLWKLKLRLLQRRYPGIALLLVDAKSGRERWA